MALGLSFHIAETHPLPTSHQVALQVVGVRPRRIRIVLLVVRLNFLQLLLLLVVHAHQLYPGLLIHCGFPHWSTRASLGQLHHNLGLLVLASVGVEQLITQ